MNVTIESVRQYRNFLHRYNDLSDCSWFEGEHRVRLTGREREQFRNDPGLRWCNRPGVSGGIPYRMFRSGGRPSMNGLTDHLILRSDRTIWTTNSANKTSLLMLVDIDNKDGRGDAAGAARYVVDRYLGGHAIVETSTRGHGRHVYFLCRRFPLTAAEYSDVFSSLAQVVCGDPQLRATGVTFDNVFYGLPTLWSRDERGRWLIERRGDLMRLPYVDGPDLSEFASLKELDSSGFKGILPAPAVVSIPRSLSPSEYEENMRGRIRRTRRADPDRDHPSGLIRRATCWSEVMRRTDGACSVEDCLEFYHAHYTYTGSAEEDLRARRRDFERLFRVLGPGFRPAGSARWAFAPGRYTRLVSELVPAGEFIWRRPERLDHAKLADFVGVKVQDAFYPKEDDRHFARAARTATTANFRVLRSKGLVGWICTSHQYAKLLDISVRYGLLECFEDYVAPLAVVDGRRIRRGKGLARMIGPGEVLVEERADFMKLYNTWLERQRDKRVAA